MTPSPASGRIRASVATSPVTTWRCGELGQARPAGYNDHGSSTTGGGGPGGAGLHAEVARGLKAYHVRPARSVRSSGRRPMPPASNARRTVLLCRVAAEDFVTSACAG